MARNLKNGDEVMVSWGHPNDVLKGQYGMVVSVEDREVKVLLFNTGLRQHVTLPASDLMKVSIKSCPIR